VNDETITPGPAIHQRRVPRPVPQEDEHLRADMRHTIESEVAQQVSTRRWTNPSPLAQQQPLDDLGRMSAEAVLAQYEAAAKAVEEMGSHIKDRVSALDESLRETDRDLKLIAEAAAAIRDKGKRVQLQIEEVSSLSRDIRDACTEFKRKMGV
jgi:hypothetical protein